MSTRDTSGTVSNLFDETGAAVLGEEPCPHCGRLNDRAWEQAGRFPSEGDISICIGCGEPAEFYLDGLILKERKLDWSRLNELEKFDIRRHQAALRRVKLTQGEPKS